MYVCVCFCRTWGGLTHMKQQVPRIHEPKCEIQTTLDAQPHLIVKMIHNVILIFPVTTTLCKDPKIYE